MSDTRDQRFAIFDNEAVRVYRVINFEVSKIFDSDSQEDSELKANCCLMHKQNGELDTVLFWRQDIVVPGECIIKKYNLRTNMQDFSLKVKMEEEIKSF